MNDEMKFVANFEATQEYWCPGFVQHLRCQQSAQKEEGRAAVIEVQDKAEPSTRRFDRSRDLTEYFGQSPTSSSPPAHGPRRIFVLEGLPINLIQVFISCLGVPLSFFAEHWAHSLSARSVGHLDRYPPRQYDIKNRFSLISPKLHWKQFVKSKSGGEVDAAYVTKSSTVNLVSGTNLFGEFELPFRGSEKLSCWSSSWGDSWNVLLLVDPPLARYITGMDSKESREVEPLAADQVRTCYMSIPAVDHAQAPKMESMFDDILSLYPHRQCQSTSNPMECMDVCRQLVLSAWVAFFRLMLNEINHKVWKMNIDPKRTMFTRGSWLDNSWMQSWTPRDFGGLVWAKSNLELLESNLLYNKDALGIGRPNDMTAKFEGGAWEGDAWNRLHDTLLNSKARVNILFEAYTQSASVRESQIANKQARQVGYLTSLATLFVPMSFIAAVFSMGGDYAAGQKSFYVFWTVSIPVGVLAVSAFLFGGHISKFLRQWPGTVRDKGLPT